MTRKVEQTSESGEAAITRLKDNSSTLAREIQRAVRFGKEDEKMPIAIESLYSAVIENVTKEWQEWESAVTKGLLEGLEEELSEVVSEEKVFNEMDDKLAQEVAAVAEKKDSESKEKRRKSMERRTVQVRVARNMLRGNALRGNALRGNALRGDALRGDALRGNALRGNALRDAQLRAVRTAGSTCGRPPPPPRCNY